MYCNIKKTTWKKSTKFLKAMEKLNYMQVKGKGDDLSIVGLTSKDNPIIQKLSYPHKPMSSLTNNKSSEKSVGNKKNKTNNYQSFTCTSPLVSQECFSTKWISHL